MITGRDIVCFGDDWGRHPQVLEHPVRLLARENRILWVNSLGHRSARFRLKDLQRMAEKLRTAARPPEEEPNMVFFRPLGIPWHEFRWVRRLNGRILAWKLNARMRALGFRDVLLVTNSPVMVEAVGRLGETVAVYYCLDDHAAFAGAVPGMARIEEELLGKVDVAFFVSNELFRQKRILPRHARVMPQPVNFRHFQSIADVPAAIAALPRPILGYVGLVETDNWLDLQLLAELARRRPEWSIVLVGPIQTDIREYRGLANLHFIGPVPFADVPAYVRAFQVGLLPRKMNALTRACNPLKLLEYFSVGIPVVSTNLPAVAEFGDLVTIAETVDGFEAGIQAALDDPGSGRNERIATAERLSWPRVLDEHLAVIRQAEEERRR